METQEEGKPQEDLQHPPEIPLTKLDLAQEDREAQTLNYKKRILDDIKRKGK